MKQTKPLTAETIVKLCRDAALDRKAEEVKILDLRGVSTVADFFLICSGRSEPQLRAITDAIANRLRDVGIRPNGCDGYPVSRWVVMDYGDVVVHIFHPEVRNRYALEQLWGDAKMIE